jgi:hypothetical protein
VRVAQVNAAAWTEPPYDECGSVEFAQRSSDPGRKRTPRRGEIVLNDVRDAIGIVGGA